MSGRLGIHLPRHIGIGDAIQFTSLPYNYYKTTGRKLFDLADHWVFDYNPYVDRKGFPDREKNIIHIWDKFLTIRSRPRQIFKTNAHLIASLLDCEVYLDRPYLYLEAGKRDTPFLAHSQGISQGKMPDKLITHIQHQYHPEWLGIYTSIWELIDRISRCSTFIGVDSGPAWIAACFPHIKVKKVRLRALESLRGVPLDSHDPSNIYDDPSLFEIYNPTEHDIGYSKSYLKI